MKEEIYGNTVKVRRKSDSVGAIEVTSVEKSCK